LKRTLKQGRLPTVATFDLHRREYWADSITHGITQFVLQDYHYEIIGLVNGLICGKLEVIP